MVLRMPYYCSEFRCTADKCGDNCCIGWEIDIDSSTLEYYRSVKGEFGRKLSENIAGDSPACFRLAENERCPFLNSRNLCEIYINLGEENLCQICTDHPRYYEWFDGIKEGGTGLACEESARIIITQDREFSYTETRIPDEDCDDYDEELYRCMSDARSRIIKHLQNRELGIAQRVSDVLRYAGNLQNCTDNGDFTVNEIETNPDILIPDAVSILEFQSSLEPLNPDRPEYLRACVSMQDSVSEKFSEYITALSDRERYLENIAVYFIWRHFMKGVFSGEFYSAVFFMAAGISAVDYLAACRYVSEGSISEKDFILTAKDYSKENEYSDDNLSAMLDEAYSEGYFQ